MNCTKKNSSSAVLRLTATIIACLLLTAISGCKNRGLRVADDLNGTLLRDQALLVGTDTRTYHLFVPARPSTAALVFLLHGHHGSSDQILGLKRLAAPYKIWIDIAQRENLLLVVPNGNIGPEGTRGWNDCRTDAVGNPGSDDVAFFKTLLNSVSKRYGVTASKVFVMGTSNGGLMTQRLAEEASEEIDAIAVMVASRPVNSLCESSRKAMPILVMNGTEDPLLPYDGGQIASSRGEVMSTIDLVRHWIQRNQSKPAPVITEFPDINRRDGSTVTRYSYVGGINGASVVLYEMRGAGHTEPSLIERYGRVYSRIVGKQNLDIEMAEEVWEFFSAR